MGLKIIRNDSLRIQIKYLYEVVYPKYYIELEDYKFGANESLYLFEDHLEEMAWFKPLKVIDVEKFRSDQKLRYHIKTLHNAADLLPKRHAELTKQGVEKTLLLLEEEIEK